MKLTEYHSISSMSVSNHDPNQSGSFLTSLNPKRVKYQLHSCITSRIRGRSRNGERIRPFSKVFMCRRFVPMHMG